MEEKVAEPIRKYIDGVWKDCKRTENKLESRNVRFVGHRNERCKTVQRETQNQVVANSK